MLRLRLLGDLALTDSSGRLLKLASRKDAALLAFLAMRKQPVDRSVLADLLWRDRAEEQARKSLRQSLVALRRVLNQEGVVLPSERVQRVQLRFDHLSVDAREFELAALNGDLDLAASLHGGAMLANFRSPSAGFDDWLAAERTRFEDLACGVFSDLAQNRLTDGDWAGAEEAARIVIEIDPLNEAGYRSLMRALDGAGRRNDALQQYHLLTGLLRDELDVRPEMETTALYRSIKRAGELLPAAAALKPNRLANASSTRPGLAVLPLRHVESGFEDHALADGLTEELIASLAAYRWFYVTSALQAAAYRNRDVKPRQLHDDLGVRYVLTGTLRRAGNHLLIRLDLSDPLSGQHLWSERLRCYIDEALEAHDSLARKVASTIEPEILKAEDEIALRVPLLDFTRWEQLARARRLSEQSGGRGLDEGFRLARDIARRHPDCAYAQATLGWSSWLRFTIAGRDAEGYDRDTSLLSDGLAACDSAIEIDPRYYLGHAAMGGWRTKTGDIDGAISNLRRSIDLNPSFPTSYNQLIACLTRAGRPRDALSWIEPLDLVSPSDIYRGYYCCVRALTWFYLGNDEEAISNAEESLREHQGWVTSELILIAASQRLGDMTKAAAAVQRLRQARGEITRGQLFDAFPMKRQTDFETIAELLSAAGLLNS